MCKRATLDLLEVSFLPLQHHSPPTFDKKSHDPLKPSFSSSVRDQRQELPAGPGPVSIAIRPMFPGQLLASTAEEESTEDIR